jgi:hypothetical protein
MKLNKNIILLSISILMLIILFSNISSLGVTPGRKILDYEPGAVRQVSFKILNTDNEDMDLLITKRGELKEDISLNTQKLSMSADENSKEISYSINMSKNMRPGEHNGEVMILQIPKDREKQGAYVGASLAVITQIRFNVPYPGRYAEAELNVKSGAVGEEVFFYIPVINRGKFRYL